MKLKRYESLTENSNQNKFKEELISISELFNNKKVDVNYYDAENGILFEFNRLTFSHNSVNIAMKDSKYNKVLIWKNKVKKITEFEEESGFELHLKNQFFNIKLSK